MPTPVQSASNSAIAGVTVIVTLPGPTGAGHSLVVYVGESQDTTNPTVSGITLGLSADNFAVCSSNHNNAEINSEIWYDPGCAAGQTIVTVTFNAGTGTDQALAVWVDEIPDILTLDKHPAGAGNSSGATSWASTATGALSNPNEFLAGVVAAETTTATPPTITGPGIPWTNHAPVNLQSVFSMLAGYETVTTTATQAYSGTVTPSSLYGACIASFTFAAAAAASGTVQPRATVPVWRRVLSRGLWGGQAGTTPAQVPSPAQGPAQPRSPAPRRAVIQGRAVPGITGTAPPQPARTPPRRVLARAVVLFTSVRTVNQIPPPPVNGTVQPGPTRTPPRRVLARAVVLFTPVRTVNGTSAGGTSLVQGRPHIISAAGTINQGQIHVISPFTPSIIQEWDQ
jgi:hypothetical protein